AGSPRRSARASGRAATRWGRRLQCRSVRPSARTLHATAGSTCGRPPSVRCGRPASNRSNAVTCARRVTATGSSRTGGTTAAPAGRESLPTSSDELRERYAQVKEEVGPNVTVVVATKYVSGHDLATLAAAGVQV